uniref:Ectopic P granules protein 5 homolog n=1 Tax=Strongyloides stercoralis TaxID=6248 RepID=A0AAF5I461_STRER
LLYNIYMEKAVKQKTKKDKTKNKDVVEELGPAPLPMRGKSNYSIEKPVVDETNIDGSCRNSEIEESPTIVVATAPVIDEDETNKTKYHGSINDRYQPKYNIKHANDSIPILQLYPHLKEESQDIKVLEKIKHSKEDNVENTEESSPYRLLIHDKNITKEQKAECNLLHHEISNLMIAYKDLEVLRNRYKLYGISDTVYLDQHITKIVNDDLFPSSIYIQNLLEKFRQYSINSINAVVDNQMNVINLQNSEKNVWKEEVINKDVTGICGHGSKCNGVVTVPNFIFQQESYNKFCNLINETFNHEFNKLYPLEIGIQSLITQIEWCLHRIMLAYDAEIRSQPNVIWTINEENNKTEKTIKKELRKILACLFLQLRKPVVSKDYSDYITKWIKMTVAILSKRIDVSDQIAIIIHLLRLPGDLYENATDLIIPCLVNCSFDQSISYFGLLISTLMKPISNREDFLSEIGTTSIDEDDFLVINEDSNIENPIKLQQSVLISIFDKFKINDLIGSHQKLFITKYVTILGEGLDNYSGKYEFKDFMIRIAHMQKEIICWLYNLYGASQRQQNIEYCNLIKADLSKLMVYFFYKIANTNCPIIGQVLVGLPLDGMFIVDIYKLDFILTKDMKEFNFNNLYDESLINIIIEKRRKKKWNNLFDEMNKEMTVNDACYFNALAEVVSNLDFVDISFVEQILESFMIDTKKRELFSKTGSEMVSSMLINKPECLKRILDFIGRRHADLNSYALDIFRCSNLSGVIPSIEIVNQLGKWLILFDISHPIARVAISVLKSVNWRNCYKNEEFELYDCVGKLLGQLQHTKCSSINKKIAKGSLNVTKQGENNIYLEFNNFLWDICLRLPQLHIPFPYSDSDDIINTPISQFLHIMRNCMDTIENFKTYGYFYLEELHKQSCYQAVAIVIGRLLYQFNVQIITRFNNKEFLGIFETMLTSNDSYLTFSMIGFGAKFPTNIVHFFRNIILLYLHLLITKNSTKKEIYYYMISVLKLMSLRTQVDFYNSMEFTYIFDCFVRYYIAFGLNEFSFDEEFEKELFNIYMDKTIENKRKVENSMFGFMKSYEMPLFYTKTPNCDVSEYVLLSIYTRCTQEWQNIFFEYISKGKSPEASIAKVKNKLKIDINLHHLSIVQWLQMAIDKFDECIIYPWILQTLLYQIFEYRQFFIIISKNSFIGQLYKNLVEDILPKVIKNVNDKKLKCQYELYLQSFIEKKFIVKSEYSDLQLLNIWKLKDNTKSNMTNIDLTEYIQECLHIFDYSLKRFELDCYNRRENIYNQPKWLKYQNNWIGLFDQFNNFDISSLAMDFSILQFNSFLPVYTFYGIGKKENYVVENNSNFNESFIILKKYINEYLNNKEELEEVLTKYKNNVLKRMQQTNQCIQGVLYCKKQPFKKCDRPVNISVHVDVYKEAPDILNYINQLRNQKSANIHHMKIKLFKDIAMKHAQLNDFVLYLYQTINKLKALNYDESICDNLRYIGQNIFERIMCDTLAEEMLFEPFNEFISDAVKYSAEVVCTDDRGKQRFQEQLLFFIFGGSGLLNHILHKIFQPGMFNKQSITTTYQTICEKLNTFGKAYDARQCLVRFTEILSHESEETLYNLIPVIIKFARKCKNFEEGTEEYNLLLMFSDHLNIIIGRTLPGSISVIMKDLINSCDEIIFPDSLGTALYEKLNIPMVLSSRDVSTIDMSIINESTTMDLLKYIKNTCENKRSYYKQKFFSVLGKNVCMISDMIRYLIIIMGHHYIRNPLHNLNVGENMLNILHETWDFLLFPATFCDKDILTWEVNDQQFGNFVVNVFERIMSDIEYFSFYNRKDGIKCDVTKSIVKITFPKICQMNNGLQQKHVTNVLRLAFRQLNWEQYKPSKDDFYIFQCMIYNNDNEINGIIGDISVKINWTNICNDYYDMVNVFKLFYSLSICPLSINDILSSFKRSLKCLTNIPIWHELSSKHFEDICENIFNNTSIERYQRYFNNFESILYPELLLILKKISQIDMTNDLEDKKTEELEERINKIALYVKILNKLIFSHKICNEYSSENEYITLFDSVSVWLRKVFEYNNLPCYYGSVATNLIDLSSVQNEDILKKILKKVKEYILNNNNPITVPIIPGFQQIVISYHSSIALRYEMELINALFKYEYLKRNTILFPECDIHFIIEDSILLQLMQNFGSFNEYANIEWIFGSILDGLVDKQMPHEKRLEFVNALENYSVRCLKSNSVITVEFCIIIYYYLQHLTILMKEILTNSRRLTLLKSTIHVLEQFDNKFSSNYIISSFNNMFKKLVSTGVESQFPISTFAKGIILYIKNQKLKNDIRLTSSDKIYKSKFNDFQTLLKSNPYLNITKSSKTINIIINMINHSKYISNTKIILKVLIFLTNIYLFKNVDKENNIFKKYYYLIIGITIIVYYTIYQYKKNIGLCAANIFVTIIHIIYNLNQIYSIEKRLLTPISNFFPSLNSTILLIFGYLTTQLSFIIFAKSEGILNNLTHLSIGGIISEYTISPYTSKP